MSEDKPITSKIDSDYGAWSGKGPKTELSRRDFLKGAGTGLVVKATDNWLGDATLDLAKDISNNEQNQSIEEEPVKIIRSVAVDFIEEDRGLLLERTLGERNKAEEVGVFDEDYEVRKVELFIEGDNETQLTIMANEFIKSREGHGEMVDTVYQESLRKLGGNEVLNAVEPVLLPLQDVVEISEVTDLKENPLANPMMEMTIGSDKMADILNHNLSRYPQTDIISLSLQMGKQKIEYTTHEITSLSKIPYYDLDPNNPDLIFYTTTEPTMVRNYTKEELQSLEYDLPINIERNEIALPVVTNEDGENQPLELLTEQEFEKREEKYLQKTIEQYQTTQHSENVVVVVDSDNNPSFHVKKTEAYSPELAEENLKELMELARRFPNKLIVTAGGNEGNYFYETRKKMEDAGEWNENVILVGAINSSRSGENNVEADGCDIYLDARGVMDWLSTSEATARVRAVADLIANGLSDDASEENRWIEIKDRLLGAEFTSDDIYRGVNTSIDHDDEMLDKSIRFPDRQTKLLKGEYWNFARG